METIEMLINEIDSEILKAKKAPFSGSEIIVNKAAMLDLVSRLRANYPVVIKEATQIKKERDEILTKAEQYANDTMDNAEAHAKKLVNETEIMKRAQIDAEKIHKEAEENFRKLDYEAHLCAFRVLDEAEKTINASIALINEKKRILVEK